MTHLHMDHASGISEFPSSTFVLSSAEWTAATTGARPLLRGYRPQHYDNAFDYRLVDFDGPRVDSYSTFARTFDLFGDGSIRLAFTPGHTVGHMCVLARLEDRDFVIAGDAVYTVRQLEGGPGQPRPQDPHLWRRSLQELQLFHREYPQAVIVAGPRPRAMGDARRQVRVSGRPRRAASECDPAGMLAIGGGADPLPKGLDHPAAALLLERLVHLAHSVEDLAGDLELTGRESAPRRGRTASARRTEPSPSGISAFATGAPPSSRGSRPG